MYNKFLQLKTEKPWLFWILIIPFIFVAILEFYNKYLVSSGKQIIKDAKKKNVNLKEKQDKAEAVADYHEKQADKIEKEINDIKIDKDWHLK